MKNFLTTPLFLFIFVFAVSLGATAQNVLSEEEAADQEQPAAEKQMSQEEQEMMAKWQEYATPGEAQKALEMFAGEWDYTVSWWNSPDAEPEKSTGTSENKMIMGGRYLKQKATGTSMGQEYQGMGITGYDNAEEQYEGLWIDNMGTGMMISTGSYDADAKTFTMAGTYTCPMEDNKEKSFRTVATFANEDKFTFDMYGPDMEGKEYKMMEIVYTKKK